MLYKYAIEPDVLSDWNRCRATMNLMGFEHARALAAYPTAKKWKRMVLESCEKALDAGEIGDRQFMKIREKIQRASQAMSVSFGPGDDYDESFEPRDERWIRNAVARQITKNSFHAILSTRNPEGHEDVVLEEDVDAEHPKLSVRRTPEVLREPEAFAAHVATLVRNSKQLFLVDPHFDPGFYRWRPVVRACLELALTGVRAKPLDTVEIHTLDSDGKWSLEEYEKRCRARLHEWLPGGLPPVRICRWRVLANSPDDFHERYVLTERGGYKPGKGLDEEVGKEQPVGLLEKAEHRRLWNGFAGSTPFYEKDGEFILP